MLSCHGGEKGASELSPEVGVLIPEFVRDPLQILAAKINVLISTERRGVYHAQESDQAVYKQISMLENRLDKVCACMRCCFLPFIAVCVDVDLPPGSAPVLHFPFLSLVDGDCGWLFALVRGDIPFFAHNFSRQRPPVGFFCGVSPPCCCLPSDT